MWRKRIRGQEEHDAENENERQMSHGQEKAIGLQGGTPGREGGGRVRKSALTIRRIKQGERPLRI